MDQGRLTRVIAVLVAAFSVGIPATAFAMSQNNDPYVTLTVAEQTKAGLQIRTLAVPRGRADEALQSLEETGAEAGRTSKVWALGDPLKDQQWGYKRLGGDSLTERTERGRTITVAVLDTGVDSAHPDLKGVTLPGYDFIAGRAMTEAYDDNGHGTHVAGIIGAIAGNGIGISGLADVRILPVKVLDSTGYGDDAGVAKGLVWAVDQGADVLNLSLGTYDDNPALEAAVEYAAKKGVVVVAASGNDGTRGKVTYPAAYPAAVAVAATTSSDTRAVFSSTGSYVDLAAPGQGILSTVPGAEYAVLSGTSMATPHVSAAVAVTAKHLDVSAVKAVEVLENTAIDLGAAGKDAEFGAGLVDLMVANNIGKSVPWTPSANPTLPKPTPPSVTPPKLDPLPVPSLKPYPLPSSSPPTLPAPTLPAPSLPSRGPGPNPGGGDGPVAILATSIRSADGTSFRVVVRVIGGKEGDPVEARATGNGGSVTQRAALNSAGMATFVLPRSTVDVLIAAKGATRKLSTSQ